MEEPAEPFDDEDYDEEAPKKARSPLVKIVAVVVALAVAGVGVWYFVFSNNPPSAAFTVRSDDLRVIVDARNSSDPDGNLASYSWDWGDGTARGSGREAAHEYAAELDYTITLTVSDTRGASSALSRTVSIQVFPVAQFVARHDRMTVSFDASGTFHALGEAITTYAWDFGDGTTNSGVRVTHDYGTAARYRVTLTVTDARGRSSVAERFASPAPTTVDILADSFFVAECPYRDYWDARFNTYGDAILRNEVPCTNYYPWVLFSSAVALQRVNPSYVYTLYRWDARVRNHGGYNLQEPVMLPVFNPAAPALSTSEIKFNLTFEYLDTPLFNALRTTAFSVNRKYYSDGFGHVVRGNYTMDLAASRRVFGVVAANAMEARAWWAVATNSSNPDPRQPGPLETQYASWLEALGNGKYDVYNGFEWFYETDITWLEPTVDDDGTTHVAIFTDGWSYEVLQARWFYWGKADYRSAVCVIGSSANCTSTAPYGAIQPQGWMPMETCWCEAATVNGTISTHLDLDFVGIQGYHFQAWGNWGPDGIPKSSDDLPAWVFVPNLMDYVPRQGSGSAGAQGYPHSELRWYEGMTSVHGAPGSYGYGDDLEYLVAPTRWPLNAGSSLTIVLPRIEIPWYDPVQSYWDADNKIGIYTTFMSTLTLRLIRPLGDYWMWDSRAKVLSLAGPHSWGGLPTDLPQEGWPWIEFAPETAG